MTIHVTGRAMTVFITLLALAAALAFVAYTMGASSRRSDTDVVRLVDRKVSVAVGERGAKAEADQRAAVRKAVKAARRSQLRRDRRVWRGRTRRAVRKAEDSAYDRGSSAGFASGNAAGYTAGHGDGVEDGIDTASDELDCSDDLDVALPACSW